MIWNDMQMIFTFIHDIYMIFVSEKTQINWNFIHILSVKLVCLQYNDDTSQILPKLLVAMKKELDIN